MSKNKNQREVKEKRIKMNLLIPKEFFRNGREQKSYHSLVGNDPKMVQIYGMISRVSKSTSTVLIMGETGTGKELVARAIHAESPRLNKPFVVINCVALPENLYESELFGYEKGAFTDAKETKKGYFEAADGGTILLDEVSKAPLKVQSKLLRVLEEKTITRVGSAREVNVDVRIIAATNGDLRHGVETGGFREDLFFRLNVVPIHIPPLRERLGDVLTLADHFIEVYNEKLGRRVSGYSKDVEECFLNYTWPGNVRELKNLIESISVLNDTDEISLENLPQEMINGYENKNGKGEDIDYTSFKRLKKRFVRDFEGRYVRDVLIKSGGNVSQAARISGMKRAVFQRLMRKYSIRSADFRSI